MVEVKNFVQGETGEWEVIIGLEVHAQVASQSKLFSGASAKFGGDPNSQVSLVDAGMPGMLPVINQYCVEQAVRTGLALGAEINLVSIFDRKNYFYPDLPQGYQISQYSDPIVGRGDLLVKVESGYTRKIGITRLHLEQDAGKSMHDQHPNKTFVDLNRSGIALMEIVTEPDLRSAEEAGAFMAKLRSILRYVGTCDGNMEEGSMRCDANVSVRRPGEPYGTRCEIKNLNSIRFLMRAIDYESGRQVRLIEAGGSIDQETRLFNPDLGETKSMRSKEDSHDYRYFPDPDLLPLRLDSDWVAGLRERLPELPDAKAERFVKHYELTEYDAGVLTSEAERATYFEEIAKGRDSKQVANWVIGELLGRLNREGISIESSKVGAAGLGQLLDLISEGVISNSLAKKVLDEMFSTGEEAAVIVERRGFSQVSDEKQIEEYVQKVLDENLEKVEEFKNGKDKLLGFFVGQVMKLTGGKANPQMVNKILRDLLSK
ncbi:MAG: Asp-tRNA(Asn)/Glu-tRNA(Gln) amidotransferase GatCAB subunit B [Rhodospirillaceae bacterium]|nr:Asp-tRNA(Asn)/Glu-tRNA(Gln) amidotransferase GatCAB subunit B [Rhodospirillaceae bacterium]